MTHLDPQWGLRDGDGGDWQLRAEYTPKRLRVLLGGVAIADSRRALIVTESGRLPVYYFPENDVRTDLFEPSGKRKAHAALGEAVYWRVRAGGKLAEDAVWRYEPQGGDGAVLRGYYAFVWRLADAWYEEEEEVFVHARDPYSRIDAIPSSRHVRIVIGDTVVADSRRPVILYETGLTPRYYLPKADVRFDLLTPSETSSRCPYKGQARYWHARVNGRTVEDAVWSYDEALPEAREIAGRVGFYNERVDAVIVDGEAWTLSDKDRLPYGGVK
ncbi:DUF427 domain-containing protein [Cohnella nanjingensis]|uniref:DUF427 domain-containing protein n=1 Tax=Cohnella nanjingensis TaxID=1387779 RepID=A0A7X0RXB1_9BACL|nr:DUF427 domain-containing protein [Cohnella nanjingensis]MBB6675393.1 DUF427 domain-containing protein [Cohnella nanjingensis]